MIYACCDQNRRAALRDSKRNPTGLNGIDYVEVEDRDAPSEEQRLLRVSFVLAIAPGSLGPSNIRIEGGERIRDVIVTRVTPGEDSAPNVLMVEVSQPGDFSTYTLRLVRDAEHSDPPPGYDPALAAVEFSFKVECPTDFDCQPRRVRPPAARDEPEINYLAKDYASFRRLLLDRLAAVCPQWQERHPADLGVALVELLAYVGDYLSYQQDAVATEAYLGTARRRVSVRRHARLVDYAMHDGCNARAWVQVRVDSDTTTPLPKGTRLFTQIDGQPPVLPLDFDPAGRATVVFETMFDAPRLYASHNTLSFYAWSDRRCCLPRGATRATLADHLPNLKAGDVLIFEEVLGPETGRAGDADPSHRHAVRLTRVVCLDERRQPLTDPLTDQEVTNIEWHADDALPFPLCVSSRADALHGGGELNDVSVAHGNIVPVDHGLTIHEAPAPSSVPEPARFLPPSSAGDRCAEREPAPVLPRYRPRLPHGPVTFAEPVSEAERRGSATRLMRQRPADALPAIELATERDGNAGPWEAKRDLLNSDPNAREFLVEVETDGTATLRFGDNVFGRRPEPGTEFRATYRVGNGSAGNIGADTLAHIATAVPGISGVRNPLPAVGGMDPETIEEVRVRAPAAFRTQERAVTEADYAAVTKRDPRVQSAAATFRWTGSWHTAFVTVDRLGGEPVDDVFRRELRGRLERYRMAGYDLEVDAPRFVSLEIDMRVCVQPDYLRNDVRVALLELFSNRTLPEGRLGLFHPDRFTFGQTVHLSPLYAAAQRVPGVVSVRVTKFRRQGATTDAWSLSAGKILLNRLEIARLDNDPNLPEHGVFQLTLGGGR